MDYPEQISLDLVEASLDGEHYAIRFDYDADAVAVARRVLKGGKWHLGKRAWMVKRRWHKSLPEWLAAINDVLVEKAERAAELAAEQARKTAEALAKLREVNPGWCEIRSDRIAIQTPYHPDIVALMRAVRGKFDGATKTWLLPLDAAIELLGRVDDIDEWVADSLKEREAREKEREAKEKTRRQEISFIERVGDAPAPGTTIRWRDEWMTVTRHTKPWVADENTASIGGPIGAEGELICRVFLRPATPEEAQTAQDEADTELAAEARRRARHDAISAIRRGELAPLDGTLPKGEILWKDERSALYGYSEQVLLGHDGYLYHVSYDGSDGGSWGQYNGGWNTIVHRVKADPQLVEAISGRRSP